MFSKYDPQELRIYLKPILDAVEADRGNDWVFLWGESRNSTAILRAKFQEAQRVSSRAPKTRPRND